MTESAPIDLDPGNIPRHIGLIMDGNGRWATARSLPRTEGHRRGMEALRRTIKEALVLGVEYLTIFSFSSENWTRPIEEVNSLMGLLKRFIHRDLAELHRQGVRVVMIGDRLNVPKDILSLIEDSEELTKDNDSLTLVVAFNYGARDEIVRAISKLVTDVKAGSVEPDTITSDMISDYLDTAGIPDPDLIIRSSGEQRLSNFLLWQSAYTEFVFTETLWPDFDAASLQAAIGQYQKRERRFGDVGAKQNV